MAKRKQIDYWGIIAYVVGIGAILFTLIQVPIRVINIVTEIKTIRALFEISFFAVSLAN